MNIETEFDGAAIEVISASDPRGIALALRPDNENAMMQWFSFRVTGARGEKCFARIVNASHATYAPVVWDGYRVAASYGGESWFRLPTTFDGDGLTISFVPATDSIDVAYFAPYSVDRRERLLERVRDARFARCEEIGKSLQGRPMNLVIWGDESPEKKRIWITARQHPGETMAEWFAEGALERLLDESDDLTKAFLDKATFYIVTCVNPDGGVLGNQRTNAAGTDLNRSWLEPSEEHSAEVLCVRERMIETGVDAFLDVHGDEKNPYIFAAGCEGNPSYDERMDGLEDLFMKSLMERDEDFQREYGYDRDAPGQGDLSCASNWVGERFNCLSLTLEMPFKDDANHPNRRAGWSPARCKTLARHSLESLFMCIDSLR